MEINRVMIKNELLLHAMSWIRLKDKMSSKGNHTQKSKNCIIPAI